MKTIIEVSNLSYSYSPETEILKNISFALFQEDSLGIIGPNGAGKTTLLYALTGLIETKGKIIIDNILLSKKNIREIRKKISFVFQNPDDQLFMQNVFEDIAFGLENLGLDKNQINNRVKLTLKKVGLADFGQRNAHHLSLGEKKKVCLASALVRESKIMFFDEPTNELDPFGKREFINYIDSIKSTKIIISHDINLIKKLCNKVIILNQKQIKAFGQTAEIIHNKELMEENRLELPC